MAPTEGRLSARGRGSTVNTVPLLSNRQSLALKAAGDLFSPEPRLRLCIIEFLALTDAFLFNARNKKASINRRFFFNKHVSDLLIGDASRVGSLQKSLF